MKPIYIDKADQLTPGTVDQILSHDINWKKICGKVKK